MTTCDRPTCSPFRPNGAPYSPDWMCEGCAAAVCTATPASPERHWRCRHGNVVTSAVAL